MKRSLFVLFLVAAICGPSIVVILAHRNSPPRTVQGQPCWVLLAVLAEKSYYVPAMERDGALVSGFANGMTWKKGYAAADGYYIFCDGVLQQVSPVRVATKIPFADPGQRCSCRHCRPALTL